MDEDRSKDGHSPEDNPHKKSSSVDEIQTQSKGDKAENATSSAKKESLLKKLWKSLDLNLMTLQLMFKGAVSPTIAIAIYQAPAIARIYSTLGYLVAIMSILSMPIMPRAKFIMTMSFNILGICVGSAVALLTIYCSVEARKHTSPPVVPTGQGDSTSGQQAPGYNSSASAVCAIWLIANIYLVNTLRASRPQLQLPVIMYSIFAMVTCTYAPSFPTMASGISFVKRLLEAFLLGFAISFGVSFVIFPKTCRGIYFLQCGGMIKLIQGIVTAQTGYIKSLETRNVFNPAERSDEVDGDKQPTEKGHQKTFDKSKPSPPAHPEAVKLKALLKAAGELQGKIYADISFAKREIAYGKLKAEDIDSIHKLFQSILLPIYGMSSITDIFARVSDRLNSSEGGSDQRSTDSQQASEAKIESMHQWNEIMKKLRHPFEFVTGAMVEGLQHAAYTLELEKLPKQQKKKNSKTGSATQPDPAFADVEASAAAAKPGDTKFSVHLKRRIDDFYASRQSTLKAWLEQDNIESHHEGPKSPLEYLKELHKEEGSDRVESPQHNRAHRQLFMILYMEFLLWSTGQAVLKLAEFADQKVEQGVMKRSRIINPGAKRIRKLFLSVFKSDDVVASEHTPDSSESGAAGVYEGASYRSRRDPEHLAPANAWEKFTNTFRIIAEVLRSSSSAFGLRCACATFTVGIVAYLESTQEFFRNQRLVWAMIMVAIGMTTTAGAGIFGFVGRVGGTVIAMCTSLIIWYIVVGHTAGVIVFLFLFTFVEFYFILKKPRLIVIALLSIVTQVLVIGYELQVQQVGVQVASSNGQPYYPTSLLAPYRLATVAGGTFVAFIWTFFPYPLTERSQLRKDLGVSLYLLANFYSVIHTTVSFRVQGKEGSLDSKDSPGYRLDKARRDIWDKEMALIASLRQHAEYTSWEPTFGGRFPKEVYLSIIEKVSSIMNYLALISYASATFTRYNNTPTRDSYPPRTPLPPAADGIQGYDGATASASWLADFAALMHSIGPTSQEYTSCLTLLSGSLSNSLPLPPYLRLPPAYNLSARMECMDKEVLSVRHVQEPGYAAFAVMQVASSVVRDDLEGLIEQIKLLVGEVDFSFHVHGSSVRGSEETLWEKWEHKANMKVHPGGEEVGGVEKGRKQD